MDPIHPPVPPQDMVLGVQEVTCWEDRVGRLPEAMAA